MGDVYAPARYFVYQKMCQDPDRLTRLLLSTSWSLSKSWSLTSPSASSFSATDGLGTLELKKYFCCTDPSLAPSFLGANLKKQQSSGHGFAQDIPEDRKGWPVISAGAALSSQMPLQSYMKMTKTRCNSLIFLSCLPVSIFKHVYSVGMKIWLRDTCAALLPRMVLVLC